MASGKRRTREGSGPKAEPSLSDDDPWLLTRIRESITSGLVVLDGAGFIVSFNRGAEEITGFSREAMRGRHLASALGEVNAQVLEAELSNPTSRFENREISIRTRAGNEVTIGFTVSPLVDEGSRRLGTIFIFKDLTEIVSLREEMRRREHLATVGEMTASIAHEIRNPLAAMHTAAETLKEELGYDEDKDEYIELILREVKRLNTLVSDFFSYIKPMDLKLEPCDLHEILDVLMFIEGAKMRKGGISVSCRLTPQSFSVRADRNLLQQAILNILLNAYQASPASGEIDISTELARAPSGDTWVRLAIADQGSGIEPDALRKIFEPFFSTKTKGIGLGLPITERIIKALGGRLEVTSSPGHGSTFTVWLPAAPG